MKKCLLIYTSLFLIISSFSFAGEGPKPSKMRTLIVSGKIIDGKNNESLAGVKIEGANLEKTIYSDLEGRFFIYLHIDSPENFKLEISQIGYSSKTIAFKEISANPNNLQIDLIPE